MKNSFGRKNLGRMIALRISLIYALAGCLWILLSDRVLSLLVSDAATLTRLQTVKGWLFVSLTALLLFILIARYIAEVERSEKAFRESEETLGILADAAASAIFMYDDTFVSVNRATEALTGYTAQELLSRSFCDILHPDFKGSFRDRCDALARGSGEFPACELRIITKSGEERWIDFTSRVIQYHGRRCGLGTAFDITGRKQAEQTLKESEERFRMLIERVKDYEIFMLDTQGRIVTWNVGVEQTKGYSAAEIIGSHHAVFFTREDVEAGLPERELETAATEGRCEDEGWRVRKDGSLFWANVVTTPLYDDRGTLRGYAKVVRDITDKKKAADSLRESEERYRIIAETASDALITVDGESVIQFVNPAAERIFGYRPEELTGRNITILMPERLREAHLSAVKHYVSTGEKTMQWNSIELPGLHRSGAEVPLEISYGEFLKAGKHFFTGIVRDVTERIEAARNKEYRDMLERFNQELESLVAERTMNLLAMTLADRVRNPASAIGATAERMLRKVELPEKTRESLGLIVDEAGKLEKTVKDFQAMLKSRQVLFHYEDIGGIVRDVLPVIERERHRKNIDLAVCLPDSPLRINTERNLLKMALFTILKNAIELTPDEGKVSVSVLADGNRVRVVVTDNGYGIPQDEIDGIFDPFSRGRSYRFGLGLPLIKQIVSEHLGGISVESGIGKGTTVTMTFPVRWGGVEQSAVGSLSS